MGREPEKTTKPQVEPKKGVKRTLTLKLIKNPKGPRNNIAFKCNFCNGGASDNNIGYHGVCNDDIIHNNIEIEKRVWCSSEDCDCRRYLDGEITRTELDSICEDYYSGSVCYESQMLRDWKVFAGIVQSGKNKGRPMKLNKLKANSLVVLTTRKPNTSEEERFVIAVFLVDETCGGDLGEEGYITTSSNFRIKLSPKEAHKMLFWNYLFNENRPDLIRWGFGLHRYLSDAQAAQILIDIIDVKSDISEKNFAMSFFDHFCYINGIDKNQISFPSGTLAK